MVELSETSVIRALEARSQSSVGMRAISGAYLHSRTVDATGTTFEMTMATAVPFDAIRVIVAVGQNAGGTAITPTVVGGVASVPDATSDGSYSGATWVQMTVGGATSWTMAPPVAGAGTAANLRRTLAVSDWMPVASVDRTDGFPGGIAVARVHFSFAGSGPVIISGNGSSISFTNWAAHPSGRVATMRSKTNNYASANQTLMYPSVTSAIQGSPILAIQYLARGKVVTLVGFGDSITEGQGGTYYGAGFGLDAAIGLSANGEDVAYEWANLGWTGQSMSAISQHMVDAVAADIVPPDAVVVVPSGSPNNFPTTIAASGVSLMRGRFGSGLGALSAKRVYLLPWTWLPSNTAAKAYGATDSLRRSYNAEVRAMATRGAVVADLDAAIAGVTDGAGQIQMVAGSTSDDIHPNDTGNALMSPVLQAAVRRLVIPSQGFLAT